MSLADSSGQNRAMALRAAHFKRSWFLICLGAALFTGYVFAEPLSALAEAKEVRRAIVATVLFVMALPLEFGTVWQAVRRPLAVILAVVVG